MVKVILFVCLMFLFSCKNEYKYEFKGYVETNQGKKEAIWYCDTFNFEGETAYYFNSDGSIVKINPPYILKHLKLKK